jgi:hypothetical protein
MYPASSRFIRAWDNAVARAAMSWGRRQGTFFWLLIVVEFLLAIGGMWVAGQR